MSKKNNSLTYDDYVEGIENLNAEEQLSLLEKISARLKKNFQTEANRHRITELEGLGADIWKDIDIQDYLRNERESWD